MNGLSFRRSAVAVASAAAAAALLPGIVMAKGPDERASKRDKRAFFDSRQTPAAEQKLKKREKQLAESPAPATEALEDSLGSEGIVAIDPLTATPRMVGRTDGRVPHGSELGACAGCRPRVRQQQRGGVRPRREVDLEPRARP